MTEAEKILTFLKGHPFIAVRRLAKKAKVPPGSLANALSGLQELSEKHVPKLKKALLEYQYKDFE